MRFNSGPVAWMVNHGVAPNLLMAFFIIGGNFCFNTRIL